MLRSKALSEKVILLGLDGLDPKFSSKMVDEGHMPNLKKLIEGITIACIGPNTAETAEKNGLKVDICAEKYTIDGLVDAIQNYFTK